MKRTHKKKNTFGKEKKCSSLKMNLKTKKKAEKKNGKKEFREMSYVYTES